LLPAANRAVGIRQTGRPPARQPWTDIRRLRLTCKRRRGGRCLRLAQISTWRRFNLPPRSGIHRADCEGQAFDPYSV